ncbi:MAG: MFS transporter [Proteobacteria bacterium]|nr:MFS transporter [Pseudomonadota bacterium]
MSEASPPRSLATLRSPHFATLWSSNLVHFSAWFAQLVVLQWLVTALTDSRTLLGLVGFVQGAALFLLSPVAGVAVDRWPKRRLLISGRLAVALLLAVLAVDMAAGTVTIAHILLAAVGIGALSALLQPATQTYVLDVVGGTRLQSAIALNAGAIGIAQTAGPLLGGVAIAALGLAGAAGAAAGALAAAALLLALIPIPGLPSRTSGGRWWADLREGWRYVASTPPVWMALAACSASMFNGGLAAMRPIFARHVLEVGSAGYGVLAGVAGLGGILTAVVLATLPPLRRPGLWIASSMLAFALCLVLYSFAFSYPYVLAVEFASGVMGQLWMVSTFTGLQMAVPETMRGRVMSLVFMVVTLAPVGNLFVGMLADRVGDQWALALFGAIPAAFLSLLLVFGWRQLRAL